MSNARDTCITQDPHPGTSSGSKFPRVEVHLYHELRYDDVFVAIIHTYRFACPLSLETRLPAGRGTECRQEECKRDKLSYIHVRTLPSGTSDRLNHPKFSLDRLRQKTVHASRRMTSICEAPPKSVTRAIIADRTLTEPEECRVAALAEPV